MLSLKRLRSIQGQAIFAEYVLVFFIVVGMMTVMTVYFKRAVQARIRDSRDYMVKEVKTRTAGYYSGNLITQYEPYYTSTNTTINTSSNMTDTLNQQPAGEPVDAFEQTIDEQTIINSVSNVASPKFANPQSY